ncbi:MULTISPECIES: hypothetical protein [Paraburkholderia]|uniref:hypothetical protein n=1 Tax=Paraburkholderia TaxID=1822464 RepID=UPI00224DFC81|nr:MULTISPECIES: hypothetical protein [Paraburkholderia]MCX4161665.1 hypothetical protein [Paraburkholderia megapolitana]MDN7157162.1 hypothetical protein [Paraburkholderia sp. CHISQ3]MDQ6494207.1 hypothetical protein [Paraburkholderia megapolitana]
MNVASLVPNRPISVVVLLMLPSIGATIDEPPPCTRGPAAVAADAPIVEMVRART